MTITPVSRVISGVRPILLKKSHPTVSRHFQGVLDPLPKGRSSRIRDSRRSVFLRVCVSPSKTDFFNRIGQLLPFVEDGFRSKAGRLRLGALCNKLYVKTAPLGRARAKHPVHAIEHQSIIGSRTPRAAGRIEEVRNQLPVRIGNLISLLGHHRVLR